MKKEIEVWIHPALVTQKSFEVTLSPEDGDIKATLSFEIPEKSVTITESYFDFIARKQGLAWKEIDDFKKELFGKES